MEAGSCLKVSNDSQSVVVGSYYYYHMKQLVTVKKYIESSREPSLGKMTTIE